MDPKAARQRDEQAEASLEGVVSAAIESRMLETHTCLPGIIQSFNPATQTATVQAAIQRILVEEGAVNLPLCVDVPVVFPAGGNFVLTFPVHKDDECILVFSERAIDFWWARGGVQLPAEYRLHDLSDAFAIVGVSSQARPLPNFSTDAVELRTRSGDVAVRVDSTGVTVGTPGLVPAQPAVMGTALLSYLDSLATAINARVPAPGTVVPALPTSAPALVGPLALLATKTKVR